MTPIIDMIEDLPVLTFLGVIIAYYVPRVFKFSIDFHSSFRVAIS